MILTIEQQALLQNMLGDVSLHFTKLGIFMCRERMADLDELVAMGALTVEEGDEPWGWTVTYRATNEARLATGIMALKSKQQVLEVDTPSGV